MEEKNYKDTMSRELSFIVCHLSSYLVISICPGDYEEEIVAITDRRRTELNSNNDEGEKSSITFMLQYKRERERVWERW